jgi:hypothetical protein
MTMLKVSRWQLEAEAYIRGELPRGGGSAKAVAELESKRAVRRGELAERMRACAAGKAEPSYVLRLQYALYGEIWDPICSSPAGGST